MKKFVKKVVLILENDTIKKFKRIILFVFLALIVVDILLVTDNDYPTFSRIIHNLSPYSIVLIWLFGLFVTNIFFQREVNQKIRIKRNFGILATISVLLLALGLLVKQPTTITCDNYKSEIEKIETAGITKVYCQNIGVGHGDHENCNCDTMQCTSGTSFKLDFTNEFKFFILILGIGLGYCLWPFYDDTLLS